MRQNILLFNSVIHLNKVNLEVLPKIDYRRYIMKEIYLFILLTFLYSSFNLSAQKAMWVEKISGTSVDIGYDIEVDDDGNIYVIGTYSSPNLTFNNGKSLINGESGYYNTYIAKYDSNGLCQWAEKIAGAKDDYGWGIALDGNSNVYVVGATLSPTLTFNNSKSLISIGSYDAYIAKYDSSGLCQWAEKIAGTNQDWGRGIDVDTSGNVYVIGEYRSSNLTFNNGKYLTNSGSGIEAPFIAKYNSNGVCQWAEKISGTNSDFGKSICVDGSGNVFVTGRYFSSTLSFNNGKSLTKSGTYDVYLAKYDSSGVCQWAEKIAGTSDEWGNGIGVDALGNVYVIGYYSSSTLSFNNDKSLSNSRYDDVFIAKYNSSGLCQWAEKIAGIGSDYVYGIDVDAFGNVYFSGSNTSSTLEFNNGKSLSNTEGGENAFVAKYNGSGLCQWVEKIAGTSSDYGYGIDVDDFGKVYVIGYFASSILTFNNGKTLTLGAGGDTFIAKYSQPELSTITTKSITKVTSKSCSTGGSTSNDGGASVTARGVCWSITQNPTIDDNKTDDGNGIGSFTSSITGLNSNTTYYVRAYSTNLVGTAYGDELSFKTANFDIPLGIGWNLISSFYKPSEPDSMQNICMYIDDNMLIAKNNGGQVFIPSYDINTIVRWDVTQSYLVYMSVADTLSIYGSEVVPSETPISLSAGWNSISYLRNTELSAELSLVSITDNNNLLIAKTLDGNVFIPSYDINTIGNLKPGVGYKIYVTTGDTLVYPGN